MDSNFFNSMGIGNWDFGIVIFVMMILLLVSIITVIVLLLKLNKLKKRFERFSAGRNAKSLEEEIGTMFEQNKAIKDQVDKNRRDIKVIYHNLRSTFQKVGLVRYDAYSQMGGKLSFSLALLDEKDNGFIINSIHGTDGCYTYSKEITGGVCEIALGAEEQEALTKAMAR